MVLPALPLNNPMNSVHEKQEIVSSGRPSIAHGVRHAVGLTVRPEQMLQLIHDFQPNAPLPFDAQFEALGIEDAGSHSQIQFYFTSIVNPLENCLVMPPQTFFDLLKRAGDGLIPTDAELDGIEVSSRFTIILLRVKSDHFPPHPGDKLPMVHLRYEAGELVLLNPLEAIRKDRRIQISDKR